jgi:hypothetical protein
VLELGKNTFRPTRISIIYRRNVLVLQKELSEDGQLLREASELIGIVLNYPDESIKLP